ncbi:Ferrous iron transport protein B [Paraliobacillus sp. PM-2]|uniref:ferrous iron transport protein B n=1 Tax=Paraliobacillus sp. PM-2 TaxID=1462524 RepID=UPI00061BC7F2|nr:ferrous iron transport protein B [Paraliobacillus sp. PM-2]CQR47894.1 Ferrous iron transport protein B [Paraliobacillus sp. PM-2]
MNATFALIGNPNTGKTSLFNALTGSYQYVGNWSGVTVEKKVGTLHHNMGTLVDLPGIYTMNPISADEAVVSNYLLEEPTTPVLNIIDTSQLKRNLHVTIQLLERNRNVLLCLNMIDVANERGIYVDNNRLSSLLNIDVTPIIARKEQGIDNIFHGLNQLHKSTTPLVLYYGSIVEKGITSIEKKLSDLNGDINTRWLAIQYLQGNRQIENKLSSSNCEIAKIRDDTEKQLQFKEGNITLAYHIMNVRETFIQSIVDQVITIKKEPKVFMSEKIDQIVTNKFLGIPIFLFLMYMIFMVTFNWIGFPLSDLLDVFLTDMVAVWFENVLAILQVNPFIESVILEGIIGGVGGVLVFTPQIFILFFCLSLLEDSGYMARITVVMDRFMQAMGLNGKAFIPLIIGFGCNVPGIMAARSIEQERDRLITMVMLPFMSCSARLPVYALFISVFFKENQALIALSLYVLGIVIALLLAKILTSTTFKKEKSLFIMELPPYRMPQWRTLWRATWEKGKGFIRKAGTFIFGGSVIIWLLTYMGPGGIDVPMDESYLAQIGAYIAPFLAPLGFGTWQAASSLLTGFLAKEVVVSTMSIIYAAPEVQMQGLLAEYFSPLTAYGFMTFILLYVPCLATVAVMKQETHSIKWTMFAILYGLVMAYIVTFLIIQCGRILGIA